MKANYHNEASIAIKDNNALLLKPEKTEEAIWQSFDTCGCIFMESAF